MNIAARPLRQSWPRPSRPRPIVIIGAGDIVRDVVGRWVADGFGEPIAIGGVTIRTGDYAMADRDGVAIIPQEMIAAVTDRVEEVLRTENKVRTAILSGVDPVDAYLKYRKF